MARIIGWYIPDERWPSKALAWDYDTATHSEMGWQEGQPKGIIMYTKGAPLVVGWGQCQHASIIAAMIGGTAIERANNA